MQAYVYAIIVDGVTRYIGKGRGGRIKDHLRIARGLNNGRAYPALRVHRRLAKAIRDGSSVVVKKVLVNLADDEAFELERRAIEYADRGNLWNVADGGVGMTSDHMRSVWLRAGHRDRMSAIMARRWADPMQRERIAAPQRAAMAGADKAKMSARSKATWANPSYVEDQKTARASPEYKAHLSAAIKLLRTPEMDKAYGDAVARSWADPEKRAARFEKRSAKYQAEFHQTTQHVVLTMIRSAPSGISTREIKTQIQNARGAIEKLTRKGLIEKRGGKYGLFFITEGNENVGTLDYGGG